MKPQMGHGLVPMASLWFNRGMSGGHNSRKEHEHETGNNNEGLQD